MKITNALEETVLSVIIPRCYMTIAWEAPSQQAVLPQRFLVLSQASKNTFSHQPTLAQPASSDPISNYANGTQLTSAKPSRPKSLKIKLMKSQNKSGFIQCSQLKQSDCLLKFKKKCKWDSGSSNIDNMLSCEQKSPILLRIRK